MGITGLLPFLEKSSKRTNINQFAGGTVAIDSYCWLHKGVFSCADKLSMGQQTDAYVRYCMKFISMLLSHKIKPILVFDGRHLPAKANTEAKRREARQANRRKAVELMQMGQHAEGRNLLRRSIDVTHEMALELIKHCHSMNIDCIVAPYEADAQLAYLNISGIADVVITEDSDLTLFGCKKVFFKMDVNGNGLLVEQDRLHLAMETSSEHFDMENFRYMCILSGCDYLASLPGIGLAKARKFIKINTDCDIHRALTRLGSYLNMKSLVVTKEYRDAFILALITFKHQLVFCPLQRKQVRLTEPTSDVTEDQLYHAGVETSPDIALQLAYGNCDPFTLKMLHDFDPDKVESNSCKSNTWNKKPIPQHISIWSKNYKLRPNQVVESPKKCMTWPNTAGKEVLLQTNRLKKRILIKQEDDSQYVELNQNKLLDLYKSKDTVKTANNTIEVPTQEEEQLSPILIRRENPFSKQAESIKVSPSLLSKSKSRLKGRNIMRVRRTIINEDVVTESKFFSKVDKEKDSNITTDTDTYGSSSNSYQSSSQKENIKVKTDVETRNTNLESFTLTDKIETESHPMDVDEEDKEISFASNENICDDRLSTQHLEMLSTSSNYDSGKSYMDTQVTNSVSMSYSTNISEESTSLVTSTLDIDSDFLIQQGDINALHSNSFQWSSSNSLERSSNKTRQSKSRKSVNSRTSVDSKTNNTRRSKQLFPAQGQQSLLSMFGFQKKNGLQN